MFRAIADGFGYLFRLLGDLGGWILDGIWMLFKPLFDLLAAIFYFLYMLGVVLVKVLEVVLNVGKLLVGVLTGLFKTIVGLSYTGTPAALPGSYNSAFSKIMPHINSLQLDKVAYVLIFGIWLTAGFMAVKIIGGMRGGGGDD